MFRVIARRYAALVPDRRAAARIFALLEAEWQRTEEALALITGQAARFQAAPELARVRTGIHLSINGLATGLRNTG